MAACSKALRLQPVYQRFSLDYNSHDRRPKIFNLGFCHFPRRYWGNHSYFLHRLMICLSSAGILTWLQIKESYEALSILAEALHYSKMSFCCILAWPKSPVVQHAFKFDKRAGGSLALWFWALTIDTLKQAYLLQKQEGAICVRNFMTHSLQFARIIALCCVLHRYGSQDIHCRNFI